MTQPNPPDPQDRDLERYLEPEPPRAKRRRVRFRMSPLRWSVVFTSGVCFAVLLQWGFEAFLLRHSRGPLDGRVVDWAAGLISERFVDERDHQELMVDALRGMTEELDPYSVYISPDEYPRFMEDTEGEYAGIGVLLDRDTTIENELRIAGVLPGGPADDAGIRPGDVIVDVAEDPSIVGAAERASQPLRRRLRGPAGTTVVLRVRPDAPADAEPAVYRVTRAEVVVPSIAFFGVVDPSHRTGYLRISQFQGNTYSDFLDAMDILAARKITGLVLDLRGNPGGVFRTALDVVSEFLPAGAPIVSTRGRDGVNDQEVHRARGAGRWRDLPLVVLIDEESASAAEIVTAAIQDHRRGVVVGERSFGKGRVQTIYSIRRAPRTYGMIKLTTQRFYTPNGRAIDRLRRRSDTRQGADEADTGGVAPDIHVLLDGPQEFRAALTYHFGDQPLEAWRRGAPVTEAPDYAPFEWTHEATGATFSDRQLAEAVACLANLEFYAHVLEQPVPLGEHARGASPGGKPEPTY